MAVKTKKTACPVSRAEFREKAQPITFTLCGVTVEMEPKEFSTLSLGWNANKKFAVKIGDKRVTCQLGLNLTLVGSKGLPR